MWFNDFMFSVLSNFTAFSLVNVFTAWFQFPLTILSNVLSPLITSFIQGGGGS